MGAQSKIEQGTRLRNSSQGGLWAISDQTNLGSSEGSVLLLLRRTAQGCSVQRDTVVPDGVSFSSADAAVVDIGTYQKGRTIDPER